MTGYSGTPLPKKLGIKEGHRVAVLRAPAGFARTLSPLPDGVALQTKLAGKQPFDVIVAFVTRRAELERKIAQARKHMAQAGGFWVAWPKKASGVATDVTAQHGPARALAQKI